MLSNMELPPLSVSDDKIISPVANYHDNMRKTCEKSVLALQRRAKNNLLQIDIQDFW